MATISERAADPVLGLFAATRSMTRELIGTLEADDLVVQTAPYTSPPKWHAGHMSWIYEVVMGRIDASYRPAHGELAAYLNSYYQQEGTPHPKAQRGAVARPTARRLLAYYDEVSSRVESFLRSHELSESDRRLMEMCVHHECQHQELLVYDLQHMLAGDYSPASRNAAPARAGAHERGRTVSIAGGTYEIGYGGGAYCYDIELPEHGVLLSDYEIDAFPVTCAQYAEFIDDGGYDDYRHWLSDGWDAVRSEGWSAPMYWERDGDSWAVRDFGGVRRIAADEPVRNVSYYEAAAYAKWAGRRLPTEAEWEVAACYDPATGKKRAFPWGDEPAGARRANLLESRIWGCAPAGAYPGGASPSGCHQMIGDVWEWTASEFSPYPGFRSGFDEYNDKWFGGQKVLRGGSFATPAASIRASYRNFFRMHERWMFAGFRCAS